MVRKLLKFIKNPKKGLRFFSQMLRYSLRKPKGILFIIGLDSDGVLGLIFRGYCQVYGFEANPARYKMLQKKFSKYKNVKLYNVAVTDKDGEIRFNISNNNGASSSIGDFREDWYEYKNGSVKMEKSLIVPSINLLNFCKNNNINYINDYISDIQGMDLQVLKTMFPMIRDRRIETITCEVTKNEKRNIYKDLPDNSEDGFKELLDGNYTLVASGWGMLKDYVFDKIPANAWEMDCKWKLKYPLCEKVS